MATTRLLYIYTGGERRRELFIRYGYYSRFNYRQQSMRRVDFVTFVDVIKIVKAEKCANKVDERISITFDGYKFHRDKWYYLAHHHNDMFYVKCSTQIVGPYSWTTDWCWSDPSWSGILILKSILQPWLMNNAKSLLPNQITNYIETSVNQIVDRFYNLIRDQSSTLTRNQKFNWDHQRPASFVNGWKLWESHQLECSSGV